jgi:hypothetical protein
MKKESQLLDLVFKYKSEHGLTAKDVDNEGLLNFLRWLIDSKKNKSIIVWEDGSYKEVENKSCWEFESDENWLTTIPINVLS